MAKEISGAITALITPFQNGEVDYTSLKTLVDFQMQNGIDGFVINGTTAESPTLTKSEVEDIFKAVAKMTNGKIPLIVGTGSNCTRTTIANTTGAKNIGADAALVVTPYYNCPPQLGLIAHYQAISAAVDFPIIPYNVPKRTGVSLGYDAIVAINKLKNVTAIKEASGDLDLAKKVLASSLPSNYKYLSGDDMTYPELASFGGHGVISVASHILPSQFCQMHQKRNQPEAIAKIWESTKDAVAALNVGVNPVAIKYAIFKMGLIKSPEVRLPLVELGIAQQEELTARLKRVKLIS